MAGDLTRGHTFSGSPATATTTDIHNLVDDAVINNLAVTTAKLAANAVDGTKLANDAVSADKLLADSHFYVATIGGTADAITLTPVGAYAAYAVGDVFTFKATADNTGATLNIDVNSLGNKPVVDRLGNPVKGGAVRAGLFYTVRYDGTSFQLVDGSDLERVWHAGSTAGTNTLILSYAGFQGPGTLVAGLVVGFQVVATNTGAVTINPDGLGDTALKKNLDEDLAAGDLQNGQRVLAVYDGTNFQMVSGLDLARVASATLDLSADSVFFKDATDSNVKQAAATALQAAIKVAIIEDQKSVGTTAGAATASAWTKRDLNTEVSDSDSLVTLASDQFTPIAGTYRIEVVAPFYNTVNTRIRLYNSTGAAEAARGPNNYIGSQGGSAHLSGIFTANGTDAYEIQYYCTNAGSEGEDLNATDPERYTHVTLTKLS